MHLNGKFKSIFDHSPNAYVLLTPDLVIGDANAAYLRATTSRLEDIIGRSIFDAFPHDPYDPGNAPVKRLRTSFLQVLQTGLPDHIAVTHYRVPRQTDKGIFLTDRYWSNTSTPIFADGTNAIEFILHHVVDITDVVKLAAPTSANSGSDELELNAQIFDRAQHLQESNLLLAEERLQLLSLFEQAPGFLAFAIGPEHVVGMANAAYRKLVGREDLVGKPVKQAMPELAAQGFIDLLDQVYSTGEPFIAKGLKILLQRRPHAGLETAYIDFVYQPLVDASGAVTGIFCQGHDVTERKKAEEELRLWKQAIEAAANGIMIVDTEKPDNPIMYVNPSFEHMTGYCSEELVGKNARILQGPDTDQHAISSIRDAIREGRTGNALLRNYRKDGELFWNELSVAPVADDAGHIRHFIGILRDVTQRKHFETQLEYHVNHDGLTGLPNRHLMQDRLQQAIVHAQRDNCMAGVFVLNLDRFKVVNDFMSHEAGDALLCEVAERLKKAIRSGDTVARQGGDEFVVIAHRVDSEQEAIGLARTMLEAVRAPFQLAGRDLNATCSIGIALYPRSGANQAELLRNADVSMYQAKKVGRNAFRFYAPEMNARMQERFELEADMRLALARDEFVLHYQPQIDVLSGDIVGFEALVRWQHPRLGLLPPVKFIELAEETDLIVEMGEWTLRESCRQAKQWQTQGLGKYSVAVNLSARQFAGEELLRSVDEALADSGLDANLLTLEITESLLMENFHGAAELLRRLRERGVLLSIDDFGTGYSSLSYLKRFALDELKIDRAFVRDIATDPDDAAIAVAIIAMAHQMNLKVVAEGIETKEQLDYLAKHHCDRVQGYHFSMPLSPANCIQFLEDRLRIQSTSPSSHPARSRRPGSG